MDIILSNIRRRQLKINNIKQQMNGKISSEEKQVLEERLRFCEKLRERDMKEVEKFTVSLPLHLQAFIKEYYTAEKPESLFGTAGGNGDSCRKAIERAAQKWY